MAVKLIRTGPQSLCDTPQLQRLFQEAIAQARVNHPHVVHIYFVGRDRDEPFLAMELVGGTTLTERIKQGPFSFTAVIELARQVTQALRSCLQFDILHGDIKPSNILLTENGSVKLSDFGLASRLSLALFGSTGITGTPHYLAPELAAGGTPTMHSDMYSLGVTLFEMTFGRLPFSVSSSGVQDWLQAHQRAPIEFPQPWPAEIPEGWRNVLAKLLAKSPAERCTSYDELLWDLNALRPMSFPSAGRLQRGLAWMVDMAWAGAMQSAVAFPISLAIDEPRGFFDRPFAAALVGTLMAMTPLLFLWIQTRRGTTPGKQLFQIRIADRHGLRPTGEKLPLRSIAQIMPLWGVALFSVSRILGLEFIGMLLCAAAFFATVVDAGTALLRRDRRSMHDRMFDTRVVLDASLREA